MTDTRRAILLFEYDDGSRSAFEFTDIMDAKLSHQGLPGHAKMSVVGRCNALREFANLLVDLVEPEGLPRGDSDEQAGT